MSSGMEQVKFSEFWFDLIVPFSYNKEMFRLLGLQEHKNLLPECKEISLDKLVFNDYGRKVFMKTEGNEPMVKGFEIISNNFRDKQLGINQKPKCQYMFYFSDSDTCKVALSKLKLYFFASGNGFLAIEVLTSDIDGRHALDLKYGFTYLPDKVTNAGGYGKLSYSAKKQNPDSGRYEDVMIDVTVKDIVDKFLGWFELGNNSCMHKISLKRMDTDKRHCYSVVGGILQETPAEEEISLIADSLCLNKKSHMAIRLDGTEKKKYGLSICNELYPYIFRETSRDTLLFIGDMQKAGSEQNQTFLMNFKGLFLGYYVFIYLYYLDIYLEIEKKKHVCQMIEKTPKKAKDYNVEELIQSLRNFKLWKENLCEEQEHNHVNVLFREHLCIESLELPNKIRILNEKYLPLLNAKKNHKIFISYRREGGVYLAILICKLLNQMGKDVFLDLESLQSGRFDEQLYDKIDECSNVIAILSERSMKRCIENEDDWVRKELAHAFKKNKNVIPIFMKEFEGFPEILPEEIEQIRSMQGINFDVRYFDAAMQLLLSYLK